MTYRHDIYVDARQIEPVSIVGGRRRHVVMLLKLDIWWKDHSMQKKRSVLCIEMG
jgi:hypothetical protein